MSEFNHTSCNGAIVSVNGQNPGPASGITYNVHIDDPRSGTVIAIAGVVPIGPRWSDAVDTVASPPGTPFKAWWNANRISCDIRETFSIRDCAAPVAAGFFARMIGRRQ